MFTIFAADKRNAVYVDLVEINSRRIDAMVSRGLEKALKNELEHIKKADVKNERISRQSVKEIRISKLKESRKRWINLYVGGLVEESEAKQNIKDIDKQIAELSAVRSVIIPKNLIVDNVENIRAKWGIWTDAEKHKFLLAICPKIVVYSNLHIHIKMFTSLSDIPIEIEE